MTEVFRRYGGGEPRPDDKAPIACTVRHPDAGGQCKREAIGEVWALPFCEAHGKEAELAYREELAETVGNELAALYRAQNERFRRDEALLEVLGSLEGPPMVHYEDQDAAIVEAYPPEKLEKNIDSDILAYDYEAAKACDTPHDWWCEARIVTVRFMREAYDRGSVELLQELELVRERATV